MSESMHCEHVRVSSWRFVDGEHAPLWSCRDCAVKFEPLSPLTIAAPDLADALFNLLAQVGRLDLFPDQRAAIVPACEAASAALIKSGRVTG